LIDYFKKQNYVPVVVNRGYNVGDVVEADGATFYARSARCFPNLKISQPVPATFADVVQTDSAGTTFWFRLAHGFDTDASTELIRRIDIRFADVTIVSTTRLDLLDALDRRSCPDVAPLIDAATTIVDRSKIPFFVVSEVAFGKRTATLRLKAGGNIRAGTQLIVNQVADAALKVDASDEGAVTLTNEMVMPIAMRPITIPKVLPDSGLRGAPSVKWEPLECDSRDNCGSSSFEPFAELVRAFKPSIRADELYR
jgi:hypothetical protein